MRPELAWVGTGLVLLTGGVFLNELSDFAGLSQAHAGSLQAVEASAWLAASPSNRLATAADWALAFPSVRDAVRTSVDPDELQRFARDLSACVSSAAADEAAAGRETSTSDIAAACAVLLEWVEPGS